MRHRTYRTSWRCLLVGVAVLLFVTTEPVRAGSGVLRITSSPAGAEILVDGQTHGNAPLTIELSAGNHEVTARKQFFAEKKMNVSISDDVVSRIEITLNPQSGWLEKPAEGVAMPQQVGALTIIADIDGAEIYVDGVKTQHGTPNTLENMPAGSHTVRVLSQGTEETKQVLVEPNQVTKVTFSMQAVRQGIHAQAEKEKQQREADAAARRPGTVTVRYPQAGVFNMRDNSNFEARHAYLALELNGSEVARIFDQPGGEVPKVMSPGKYRCTLHVEHQQVSGGRYSRLSEDNAALQLEIQPGQSIVVRVNWSGSGSVGYEILSGP